MRAAMLRDPPLPRAPTGAERLKGKPKRRTTDAEPSGTGLHHVDSCPAWPVMVRIIWWALRRR